jgi:uncharacterized membrane protein
MQKNRLEAFSDGVIAIIITIMVLELKVPHNDSWEALQNLIPIFLSYVLSFIYIGIYWNNHHHMLHAVHKITASNLWANLHLLFWLSLIPFSTGWMGENHFTALPSALYGINLFFAALAYWILQQTFIHSAHENALLKKAVGSDMKGKLSLVMYLTAVGISFFMPVIALCIYVVVACIWLIPDRRIEAVLAE